MYACLFAAKYVYSAIVLNALAIVATVVVLMLHDGDNSKPPSESLMRIARKIGKSLCITVEHKKEKSEKTSPQVNVFGKRGPRKNKLKKKEENQNGSKERLVENSPSDRNSVAASSALPNSVAASSALPNSADVSVSRANEGNTEKASADVTPAPSVDVLREMLVRLASSIHQLALRTKKAHRDHEYEEEWAFVSLVFDRLFFLIFVIGNVLVLFIVLVIYPKVYGKLSFAPTMKPTAASCN